MPRASRIFRSIPMLILCLWLAAASAVMAAPPIQWEKIYNLGGNDYATDIRQTRDGGYIVTAITSAGHDYAWLIKLNSSGKIEWKKSYKSSSSRITAWGVARLSDGGYAWAGEKGGHVYVVKTDSKGKTVWSKSLDSGWGWGLRAVSDGGVSVSAQGPGGSDLVLRLDKSGKTLWKKSYGYSLATSIQETRDKKGFSISGFDESGRSFLAKTDKNGKTIWIKSYSGNDYSSCKFMDAIETADGGFAVLERSTVYYPDDDYDYYDYPNYLLKTDSEGNQVWRKLINTKAWRLHATQDNGLLTAGSSVDDDEYGDLGSMQLHRFDSNGNELWAKYFDGYGMAWGFSGQQATDKGSVAAGYTSASNGSYRIYIVKLK